MIVARLRRRRARWQAVSWAAKLRVAAVVVAVAGLVASVLIAREWQATVDRQRDERLERVAASRTVTVSNALFDFENALQAERSLWVASTVVTRDHFRRFAHTLNLDVRYPGLQSIGWREVVPLGEAARFVREARSPDAPNFAIRPPGRRPVYYVMKYVYPLTPFSSPLGLDGRAMPGVLAKLEDARDSGETTMSNQTTLGDDLVLPKPRRPVAFELFVPVYEGGEPPPTVAGRRAKFLGWASGHFRAADFLTEAMKETQSGTGVELHDEVVGPGSLVASYPAGFRADAPYVREGTIDFGGRRFVLRFAPLPGNSALTERTIPGVLVGITGLAVTVLLVALLWLLAQVGALYHEVGRLARTDGLTGVANRRAWDDELPRELARAARAGQELSVALIDHDQFKAYNDRNGHQAGDRLLKAAAAAWQTRLRKADLLARYGGEEFAVLLPDCGLDSAMEIAERLRNAQAEGTCSIGVASWDGREGGPELVARADRALYAAKAGGRNRCCADRTGRLPATLAGPGSPGGGA